MFLFTVLATLSYLSGTVVTQDAFFFKRIAHPTDQDADADVEVDVYELSPDQQQPPPPAFHVREESHRIDHGVDHRRVVGRVLHMLNLRSAGSDEERDFELPPPRRPPFSRRRQAFEFGGSLTPHAKWPDGVIPFVIDIPLRRIDTLIFSAMREIESKSCVRFKKRDNEADFILIRAGHGCFSGVGRKGGRQVVSLGHGCENYGIILHELMHVVGFYHLHQRHDRDRFLQIHWDNINPLFINNFKLLSPDLMPTDEFFDYQSIMMYGATSFSRDRVSVTMTPSRSGARIADPAQKHSLSAADVRAINRMYDCHASNFLDY